MTTKNFIKGQSIKVTGGRFRNRIVDATVYEIKPSTLSVSYDIPGIESGNATVRLDGRGAHVI